MSVLAFVGRSAEAEPWSIEPRLGVSGEYDSNPQLRSADPAAEEHAAAIVDLPVRYDEGAIEFVFHPNGRISNSQGYASLAANYIHLDSDLQYTTEKSSTTLQAGLARDSSLYYIGALVSGVGVRRDTATTSVDWTRSMTERSQLQLDGSWLDVHYAEPSSLAALVDYRYFSAGPTVSYSLTERNTLKLLGTVGNYRSLNGITESKSDNAQLGFVRQLSELWSLSTSAGYSQSTNSENVFFGPFLLGTLKSHQDGAVYSATVTRQGEAFNFSLGASRALQPTGFAYLSRQDAVNLTATYKLSERWDFSAAGTWQRALYPQARGGQAVVNGEETGVHYLNVLLTANWHWTERWIVALHATRVSQQYGPPPISVGSTGFSVDFIRQFLRTPF